MSSADEHRVHDSEKIVTATAFGGTWRDDESMVPIVSLPPLPVPWTRAEKRCFRHFSPTPDDSFVDPSSTCTNGGTYNTQRSSACGTLDAMTRTIQLG